MTGIETSANPQRIAGLISDMSVDPFARSDFR
jgi:hypothetical protein